MLGQDFDFRRVQNAVGAEAGQRASSCGAGNALVQQELQNRSYSGLR